MISLKNMAITLFTVMIATSCCKDCDDCVGCKSQLEQHDTEVAQDIFNNLISKGSVRVAGNPPDATGNLSVELKEKYNTGLPNEGFDFSVSSAEAIVGVYLQVKRGSSISDGYLDIKLPLENSTNRAVGFAGFSKNYEDQSKEEGILVDIDFSSEITMEPRTATYDICYEIRAYDEQGNISDPKEICFSLLGWANGAFLGGQWEFQRSEELLNGENKVIKVRNTYCPNGNQNPCYSLDAKILTLEESGTFALEVLEYNYENADLEANYERIETEYKGNWTYDDQEDDLYLIVYSHSASDGVMEIKNFTALPGDGQFMVIEKTNFSPEYSPRNLSLHYQSFEDNNDLREGRYTEYYEKPKEE